MLRTLEGRAQLAIITLWLSVAAAVADAYAHASRLRLVQDGIDAQVEGVPLRLATDEVDRADTWVSIALVVSSVLLATTALAWLVWQYRVAALLRPRTHGWRGDPARGVAVWLVPLVNFTAPLLVVAELARGAGRRMQPTLAAWWLAWLGSAVLAGFGTKHADVLADQRLPDRLAVAGDVLSVVAALLAIGIVRHLTVAAAEASQAASA